MNRVSNKNLVLIITYLLIVSSALIGYLFMVAYQTDGYDPEIYKKAYLYFIIFQFMVFTMILPMWDHNQIISACSEGKVFKAYISMIIETCMLSISSIPLILTIFMAGQINGVNFILPLIIQTFWGMALLSLREYLNIKHRIKNWKIFILMLFIFIVLILTLVFLYFYTQYGRLVVTTVYDNDLPKIFFINPLLTIAGLSYTQIGGTNYLGNSPVTINILFSLIITIALSILTMREKSKKSGGKEDEKTTGRAGTEKA